MFAFFISFALSLSYSYTLGQPICITTDASCTEHTLGCYERILGTCFPISPSISGVLVQDLENAYRVELYGGQTCGTRAFSVATEVDGCTYMASVNGTSAYVSVKGDSFVIPGMSSQDDLAADVQPSDSSQNSGAMLVNSPNNAPDELVPDSIVLVPAIGTFIALFC
ncbi:hypothetical protein SARC_10394 [Sphaeroforma arctica JP610]|uniref:Uncharacterized protein n=1 Tax=Sphaeroforma arctica JP610 TaxID=667725 RepID=A0A0L0FK60_9EUKA|nr:hypothetical protein SARC_10394 [Sphaeroforma arctica JP610]KNC77135.1 hypothetical protein SARC_10394 [Sphaeroforma arctica JP610]|eukprot:XP_014151037.1 hypothetical protein SARC_10394 [Sphaeroforma arctica JP610]